MRNKTLWLLAGGIMILGAGALTLAQFLPEDVAQRAQWEEFLSTAEIVGEEQMTGAKSVTNPWKLTLEKDGVRRVGLWKNVSGRPRGYIDNWKFELAAYRIDKLLGLNMVPPTVERNYNGPGSFQLWMDSWMTLEKKMDDNIKIPSYKIFHWNRALYLQRFFDNLIANDDRHQNNYLITQDWRMYLIDHSRSFRTYGDFLKKLQYTDKRRDGPMEMLEIPRVLLDKIKALDFEAVRGAVGDYLTEDEIKAVLTRRDLILKEMDRICKKNGEANVLY
ncbi:MAG: hypothetical protein A2Y56_01580 [Candidatus Aminicenantes bacterium RBG_13_63_10]|nr:MAG: hypothetical protein A2Y56_01580 [Candidatus Aminicenantes bacterium RBG_13_63_10]